MNQPSDAVLEFAAILGEAIARVHLAGKQVETINDNATVESRGGAIFSVDNRKLEHEQSTTKYTLP